MTQPTDVPSAILAALQTWLAAVPAFGADVYEDTVLSILDAEDSGHPDDIIVIQPGQTEEIENVGGSSVRERITISITLMTRRRAAGPALRAARIAVKTALQGRWRNVPGVQEAKWQSETPMPSADGRRWSCQVMPLQVTYVQQLK